MVHDTIVDIDYRQPRNGILPILALIYLLQREMRTGRVKHHRSTIGCSTYISTTSYVTIFRIRSTFVT